MNQIEPPQITMVDPGMSANVPVNEGMGYIQDTPAPAVVQDPSLMDGMNAGQMTDLQTAVQAIPVQMPVSDWTAVSVTVLIQP